MGPRNLRDKIGVFLGAERESYFRKVRRHVAKLRAEGAWRTAAGTAAAQKAAATATAAAAAVAAAQKAVKAQPVDTFEEGTRKPASRARRPIRSCTEPGARACFLVGSMGRLEAPSTWAHAM